MCVGTCPASGAPVCDFSSSAEPSVGATSRPAARAVAPPSRSPKNPAAGKPECLSHTPHALPLTHVLASCLLWERDVGLAGGARGASPRGGDAANTAGCDRCSEVWGDPSRMPQEVLSSAGDADGQGTGVRRAETWGGGGKAEAKAREPCGTWRGWRTCPRDREARGVAGGREGATWQGPDEPHNVSRVSRAGGGQSPSHGAQEPTCPT